jgi:hypothetical protein
MFEDSEARMFFPFCFSVFVRTGRDAAHSGCARGMRRRPSTVQRAGARKDGGGVASRRKREICPPQEWASSICP